MLNLNREIPTNTTKLVLEIIKNAPLQEKFIQSSLLNINDDEHQSLSEYLHFCKTQGMNVVYMAECYLAIVEDMLREQIYFFKHNEYRYKTFDEVAESVYFNDNYMKKYMYGLALTSFLWPNHTEIHRFFIRNFPTHKTGCYLEVGPGHGYSFLTAMRMGNFQQYVGVDISRSSIELTKQITNFFIPELKSKVRLLELDFLENDCLYPSSLDAIVIGEVLEHVEKPKLFLKKISELIKSDGYIFVTTCINSPAIDHIYLWREPKEVESMIFHSGLKILNSLYLPYHGLTLKEASEKKLTINVAYILSKTDE